ncbi:MAG TPA: hypothetical protein DER64_06305 [Planctomycetaceae bacterium]|nr:hypothetical protein [Planctomycetaceae bacterium]
MGRGRAFGSPPVHAAGRSVDSRGEPGWPGNRSTASGWTRRTNAQEPRPAAAPVCRRSRTGPSGGRAAPGPEGVGYRR